MRVALDRAGHRLPGVPAGPDPGRRRTCRRSARRSSTPTTRPRSRPATPRCGASRSTSCSRSSSGWSRAGAPAGGRRTLAVAGRRRRGRRGSGRRSRPRSPASSGEPATLTGDQATAIDEIRDDLARPVPMLRLVQGDVGSGKTAVAAWALAAAAARRAAGGAARADGPARAPAPRDADLAARGPRRCRSTLLTGSLSGEGRRNATEALALGTGRDRGRDARAAPGEGGVRRPRAGRGRRAAPVRRRAARGARGEGDARRAARPADDRHADPAHARPGPVRGPRRLDAAHAAGRAGPDPDRASGGPDDLDGTWAACPRRGRRGAPDVRGRAPDRRRDDGDGRRRGRRAGDPFEGDDELPDEDVETAWAAAAEVGVRAAHGARSRRCASGIVHGRLKPVDRDAEMARFRDGDLDVLVGTTVVEVGVDVARGDDDGGRGRRSVRARAAPPAPWPGRAGDRGVVLRAGERPRPRARPSTSGSRRWPRRPTGSRSPSGTSSCGARATCSASPRAACRASASRRSRTPTTASWPPAPGPTPRRCVGEDGELADGGPALAARARRRLAAQRVRRRPGERGLTRRRRDRAMADAGRVIAGTAQGVRLEAPGPGTRPLADRVKQTLFAILEPDLDGAVVARPVRGQRRGRHRGAVARRGARRVRRAATPAPRASSRRTCAGPASTAAARVVGAGRDRLAAATPAGAADGRTVRPRPRRPAVRGHGRAPRGRSSSSAPTSPRTARSSPSTSGATRRRREIGLLASERERRFGETALTFYRRRRRRGAQEEAGEA